jgi:hypothetical protein
MRRRLAILALLGLIAPARASAQAMANRDLAAQLERLRTGEQIAGIPPADSVAPGARTISAGETVRGTVVARGPVDVAGHVDGSVVSLSGDVRVHRGGTVSGDALAVGGRVIADSGIVEGEMRSMATLPSLLRATVVPVVARTPAQRTLDAVQVVAGTFFVLLIIAVGVVLFAGPNLNEVVSTVERRFGRAFVVGLIGQLLVLPGLVILVVALALTLIGILLIPFAIVAYGIAVAGVVTLGFLAVAQLVGGALVRGSDSSERSRSLAKLAVGIAIFFALWAVAALLVWAPLAATVVRAAALAITWAAGTLGFGSALLSRGGTARRVGAGTRPIELAAWQTPTPVAGVTAARRPAVAKGAGG